MTKHQAMIPLAHDHHHFLAKARRMQEAAASGNEAVRRRTADDFVSFNLGKVLRTYARSRSCSRCWRRRSKMRSFSDLGAPGVGMYECDSRRRGDDVTVGPGIVHALHAGSEQAVVQGDA